MLNVIPFLLLHVLTISSLVDLTVAPENYIPNTKEKSRDSTSSVSEKITDAVLEEVFDECESILKNREELIDKLFKAGKIIKQSDRKHDLSLNRAREADPQIHAIEEKQLVFDCSSDLLIKKFQLSGNESNSVLPTIKLESERSKSIVGACTTALAADNVHCDPNSRYRTINGQCNNLLNPRWGSENSCQNRLLPANYEGQSKFRKSIDGEPLPSPRILSTNLFFHYNSPTYYVTHMFVFFGQLLDHDIALTPSTTTINNQSIECCPPENENHPQCAPIILPSDDSFYSQFGQTCMNFVRSTICATCALGPRQVMNQVTSFIDASFLYGNNLSQTRSLRKNDGTGNNQKSGQLRSQKATNGEELLPKRSNRENDDCSFPETNDICFEAGDSRANQQTVLTSLHTLFLREHNKIASELRVINPQWDDERLFQETRRILGAIVQVITYKEYLPVVLGNDRMYYLNLRFGSNTKYDSQIDPTMMIEFTTAAFRFGHSMINSVMTNYPLNDTGGHRLLRNEFFKPFDLYRGCAGPLLAGASNSPAQVFDRNLVPDVTNYLFRGQGDPFGMDLGAININRGRDHGIPTYVQMVRFCHGINVRSFRDLGDFRLMSKANIKSLQQNYRYVQDVDLFAGILLETPNAEAVVGPTAACVIGKQFRHLKFGDRFYVEHGNQVGSFTYQQLQELRKITLSKVICLNTKVSWIARHAMVYRCRENPIINCNDVKGINLSYWRE